MRPEDLTGRSGEIHAVDRLDAVEVDGETVTRSAASASAPGAVGATVRGPSHGSAASGASGAAAMWLYGGEVIESSSAPPPTIGERVVHPARVDDRLTLGQNG